MRRSLTLKMSLVGAFLALGVFADDKMNKDANKGKADAAFVQEAAIIGQTEIKLSQLAVNTATTPAVKDLAQQMIDDHTKAGDALKEVAQRKGITLPWDGSVGASGSVGQPGSTGMGSDTGSGSMGMGSTGSTGTTGTGSDSVGSTGSPGSGSTGVTGTGTTGTGSDTVGSGSPGSDTMGSAGSPGSTGATGSTGSDSPGSKTLGGSGTTSPDTYGAGSTGSDDKVAAGSTGSDGKAVGVGSPSTINTKMTSAQKAAQKKYDELARYSGEKFERAYLSALVDDHKKAIKVFEKQAKNGQDPELKTWASNTLPTLKHHLEMIQTAEKDLKSRRTGTM